MDVQGFPVMATEMLAFSFPRRELVTGDGFNLFATEGPGFGHGQEPPVHSQERRRARGQEDVGPAPTTEPFGPGVWVRFNGHSNIVAASPHLTGNSLITSSQRGTSRR